MATTALPTIQPQTKNMTDKACQLIVSSKMIGNRRKISKSKVEVMDQGHIDTQVDKAMLEFNKKLLSSKELQKIVSLNGEVTKWLGNICLPSDFKNGVYLIPYDLMSKVEAKLQDFAAQRAELVSDFVSVYPSLVQESAERLGSVFRISDYPTSDCVQHCFSFSWFYTGFETPAELKTKVSADFYDQQVQKLEEKFRGTEETITAALCEAFSELVEKIVDKTSGSEDGKKKIFRDSLVNNMAEFFETFTPRNIANTEGSAKLAQLVEKGKKLLRGLDADDLRRKEGLRTSVNLGFSKIKAQLDDMLQDAPSRRISFAEDEDAA